MRQKATEPLVLGLARREPLANLSALCARARPHQPIRAVHECAPSVSTTLDLHLLHELARLCHWINNRAFT
ncbi:hypothetical protein TcWFU_005551 [Taenia crassiceps]|uniref:Uncharacterized protein n=1 Tax=Taenia crassiceps TaxID=6207 RepID=A0ABR4QGZ4_9CEST